MYSSFERLYLISTESDFGAKIMPDRMIMDTMDENGPEYWLQFNKDINNGNVRFSHFKSGEFGIVGFNPRRNHFNSNEQVCIKFYNLAFPISSSEWDENLKNHFPTGQSRNGKWKLSAVTGVGNYVAFRYLAEAGISVPKVYLATSNTLVQESIDGYTLDEVTNHYEELKQTGELNDDIFADMWDWSIDVLPKIAEKVKSVIEPIRSNYWSPDFKMYDVNGGNIIFRKNNLANFAENYVLIDPFR